MKSCKKCLNQLDATQFSKDKTRPDGLSIWCKECARSYRSKWITTKSDAERAKMRADVNRWRRENPERALELDRQYRNTANGKAKQNDFLKRWRPANRPAVNAQHAYRRARLLRATPSWVDRDQIKQLYYKAAELSKSCNVQLVVDHIIPLISDTVCGLHCWHNLQLLEHKLNLTKSNEYQQDW